MEGAGALSAEYWLAPNGTQVHTEFDTGPVGEFVFMQTGVLGEQIPQQVDNVTISNTSCSDCTYVWDGEFRIHFAPGNYTLKFDSPVRDNHLQEGYDEPYNVTVHLPVGFDVRNPFLGSFSREANVTDDDRGGVQIAWRPTRSWDVRFYDRTQETFFILFGSIWIAAAVVLLIPYYLMKRKGK
ncbi:MAG: hypothetical protein LUQ13_02840 [Methanomicrobiales archaeon]|nr:hypothetical protein [Methanomicrobiales archaeon]